MQKLNGLESLVNLRVLMMGRNKIGSIENLSRLVKLDILDLHSNRIEMIRTAIFGFNF
jgi:leucine-rich repeat-containing protein 49